MAYREMIALLGGFMLIMGIFLLGFLHLSVGTAIFMIILGAVALCLPVYKFIRLDKGWLHKPMKELVKPEKEE